MSVVSVLKEVEAFFNEKICSGLTFKRPPSTEGQDATKYEYELVEPKAYLMYPPEEDKFPSVTIQVLDGETNRAEKSGEIKLRFLFATWSTGKHFKTNNKSDFLINSDGWHDTWNFVDKALNVLSHTTHLGPKVRIKHENKIQFGSMKDDNVLANYYPYWFAWITCTVEYGQISSNEDFNNLI